MIVHQIIIGRLFKVMLRNIQISLEHIGIIQILAFTVIQINVLCFHGDAELFCWLEGDDALEPRRIQGGTGIYYNQ